jgi:drug/metabolite transporter (DMT)-like permease
MSWLVAVVIGHFLNAISYVLDKVLLSKSLDNPFAFAFYIGVLGLLGAVLIPFGFEVPDLATIFFNLVTGATFIAALLFFFLALKDAEASRIVPFIGGGVPVFTLVFELLFLDFQLSAYQLLAFGVLVAGTVMITVEKKKEDATKNGLMNWVQAILAALFFAISFGMTKIAFDTQPFFSAFVWIRFGSFVFALTFLFFAKQRKAILDAIPLFKTKDGALYLVAQAFGAVGFIFVNYAISIASVSLVNALQGVQYALLLVMAIIGTIKYPKLLGESMTKSVLALKIAAVIVIGVGLTMIALSTNYA